MLRISDYNYPLPDERIAKYPLAERDHSKLLVFNDGKIGEDNFFNISRYLPSDSLLVYNNTRVIQARLVFHKSTGARIEVFCLEPLAPHDYQLNLCSTEPVEWKCMIGNLKKWKAEPLTMQVGETELTATLLETMGNTSRIRFSWDSHNTSFAELLDKAGELPIPPYLNRKTEESDKTTYQTVYSKIKGSVAAPTAGLHFTDKVLAGLRRQGIKTTELTLHVGAGTFQPVKTEDANLHQMHKEIISVPRQAICDIQAKLGHVVAVGTTSVRTLESLYFIGCRLSNSPRIGQIDYGLYESSVSSVQESVKSVGNPAAPPQPSELTVSQFEPYETEHTLPVRDALQAIIDYLDNTRQTTLHAETQIMIKPGYEFRIVNRMITNFHQPKSTLLLLVSAFVGDAWRDIYDYALSHDFRFLSYGDSSLLTSNQ